MFITISGPPATSAALSRAAVTPPVITGAARGASRTGRSARAISSQAQPATTITSSTVHSRPPNPTGSAARGLGPTRSPAVRVTTYTVTTPASRAAPAHSSGRDGRRVASTAHSSCSQAAASMNTPNSQYCRKCWPAVAKWMTAVATLRMARQDRTTVRSGAGRPGTVRPPGRMRVSVTYDTLSRTVICDKLWGGHAPPPGPGFPPPGSTGRDRAGTQRRRGWQAVRGHLTLVPCSCWNGGLRWRR